MKTMSRVAALAVCLVVVLFLTTASQAQHPGEALYKSKCAMCHGPDGKGATATGKAMKVKDFSSEEVQKMSDADLTDAISKGKGKMPAYKAFTPDQVKDLVGYIRAFGKKK